MKAAMRHTTVFVVFLLLGATSPRIFAQGEGNSTVNCGAGGAEPLQLLRGALGNESAMVEYGARAVTGLRGRVL